ncbi:SKP1-like protein 14 [Vigna radiata var. radiata]|uniref:SKP1-like protein 14 n=1 Tax=Vigna radiata var. radiata TaxID=3916 RepID=A0A1S3W190_VIGRR|nr:SKP1-like protein 14 [Vigna radiata var. radiata]
MAEKGESSKMAALNAAEEFETHERAKAETSEVPIEELKKLTITKEEEEEEPTIKLKTSDGIIFYVEASVVKQMQTVQAVIDDVGIAPDDVIPLHNLTCNELGRILEYRAKRSRVGSDPVTLRKFDEKFFSTLTADQIRELLLTANYLNMSHMMDAISWAIANFLKYKTVEFTRDFFGIISDYTPEEEAAYRETNAWAFRNIDRESGNLEFPS